MAFQRRTLPTDGRYIAARRLDFGDRVIEEGAPFPWQEMGMDDASVQRRWWIGELEAAPAEVMVALPGVASQAVADAVSKREQQQHGKRHHRR